MEANTRMHSRVSAGREAQDGSGKDAAAHLVRVSLTMRETMPLESCVWLLSAISAYTYHTVTAGRCAATYLHIISAFLLCIDFKLGTVLQAACKGVGADKSGSTSQ